MELTQDEYQALVGGGDNPLHFHAFDRAPTNDTVKGLVNVVNRRTVEAGTTVLSGAEDYVLADTTLGDVTIVLPSAIKGFEIEIIKPEARGTVYIVPFDVDTILGRAVTATLALGGSALRFKSFGINWNII